MVDQPEQPETFEEGSLERMLIMGLKTYIAQVLDNTINDVYDQTGFTVNINFQYTINHEQIRYVANKIRQNGDYFAVNPPFFINKDLYHNNPTEET